jgi:Protein of unknown function (DUF3105)
MLAYAFGASGVLMVAAVLAFFALAGDSGSAEGGRVAATMKDAGCTFRTLNANKNLRPNMRHVVELPKRFKHNSDPPTSGLHHPQTIIWGSYDQPISQLHAVHNLEHGGVVIQYGNKVPAETVSRLTRFYIDDPNALLLAPYPRLGERIALTAWTLDEDRAQEQNYEGEGRIALCREFDEDAFQTFVDEFQGKGPERFNVDDLQPGGA